MQWPFWYWPFPLQLRFSLNRPDWQFQWNWSDWGRCKSAYTCVAGRAYDCRCFISGGAAAAGARSHYRPHQDRTALPAEIGHYPGT
jgi:hypothetical protein